MCHRCTRAPHPECLSYLPPRTIPLGHPRTPTPSILYPASNLVWQFVSYMILYRFQCHSPKLSHPLPLPQSPKDCSRHLCLFCCLTYALKTQTPVVAKQTYTEWVYVAAIMYWNLHFFKFKHEGEKKIQLSRRKDKNTH